MKLDFKFMFDAGNYLIKEKLNCWI